MPSFSFDRAFSTAVLVTKAQEATSALSTATVCFRSKTLSKVIAPPLVPMATEPMPVVCKIPSGSLEPPPFKATESSFVASVEIMDASSVKHDN